MDEKRRVILHMDMDAFYASVEVHDDPSLKGKPLIIGALPTERGVVATCSYEARPFGVHSGQSIKEAYRLCPQGIYMHGHYDRYRQVSHQIHEILLSYTDQIQFVALDEGYLDITGSLKLFGSPEHIGREIKARVLETTGLTCSVGIGYNRMTAKLGSEEKKPDGFFAIESPEFFMEYFADRPARVIPGIGGKSAEKLSKLGLKTIKGLQGVSEDRLKTLFGEAGEYLYHACRGEGSDVIHRPEDEVAKSIGKEVTYQQDMTDRESMESTLKLLARGVSERLIRHGFWAETVTLKFKYNNLESHTRSKTLARPTRGAQEIYEVAAGLLTGVTLTKPVRLLGISTSGLTDEPVYQLNLIEEETGTSDEQRQKREKLDETMMDLSKRFGKGMVTTGGEMLSERILKEKKLIEE